METKLTKAEQRIQTALSHLIDLKHPVAMAVEPHRAAAVARAKQRAEQIVAEVEKDLEANGWDCNKCAPYPSSRAGRIEYIRGRTRYELYMSLTKPPEGRYGVWNPNAPVIVKMDSEKIRRYISDAQQRASLDFDAFIVKLCDKIGECESATIDAPDVWGYSFLHVTKSSGPETWKTQQIINQSKLGRLFNQWPSRKIKTKKSK